MEKYSKYVTINVSLYGENLTKWKYSKYVMLYESSYGEKKKGKYIQKVRNTLYEFVRGNEGNGGKLTKIEKYSKYVVLLRVCT